MISQSGVMVRVMDHALGHTRSKPQPIMEQYLGIVSLAYPTGTLQ